jgi:hypothetical protein
MSIIKLSIDQSPNLVVPAPSLPSEGAMAMNQQCIWFAVGFLPYYLGRGYLPSGVRVFEVRALFWRLRIEHWPGGASGWLLQVPLIEQLKGAIWVVVLHFAKHVPNS